MGLILVRKAVSNIQIKDMKVGVNNFLIHFVLESNQNFRRECEREDSAINYL